MWAIILGGELEIISHKSNLRNYLLCFSYFLKQNAAYIMYNDEFPNGTKSMTRGHTKGVVVMTSQGGFWLVHSVPKYPPTPPDGYSYPHSGHHYGQSMLCISLSADQAHILGKRKWRISFKNNSVKEEPLLMIFATDPNHKAPHLEEPSDAT